MLSRSTLRIVRAARVVRPVARFASSQRSKVPSDASDPYPLPLSSDSLISNAETDDMLPIRKERPNESVDTLRARLVYQTRKRGTLESDLLLSTFAKEHLYGMSETELKQFDKLLDEPDWDIYYWSIGKREPPERWEGTELLEKLRIHARNEGKVVRRMPDLQHEHAHLVGR